MRAQAEGIVVPVNKKRSAVKEYWKYKYLTLLLLPGILYYILFQYIPLYGIQIAFKEYFLKGNMGQPLDGAGEFPVYFHPGKLLGGFLEYAHHQLLQAGMGFPCAYFVRDFTQ